MAYSVKTLDELAANALDGVLHMFIDQGREFQRDQFDVVIESLSDIVQELDIDLSHVYGNEFGDFSEFALHIAQGGDYEGISEPMDTISFLHTQVIAINALVSQRANVDDFEAPVTTAIVSLACLSLAHLDDEEDFLDEFSLFDTGIGEVDDDADDLPY